ncbi:MAG: hypothetical protein QOF53_434 [Nocardioidaceae bacterium]|jgi:hypothetical protein|nr:hypothetical protein [Nocardioidaceae bacterium]
MTVAVVYAMTSPSREYSSERSARRTIDVRLNAVPPGSVGEAQPSSDSKRACRWRAASMAARNLSS